MNDRWDSADIDQAIADLKAAGWTAVTVRHHPLRIVATEQVTTTWRSPSGALYRGPAGAWRTMQREKNNAAFDQAHGLRRDEDRS